tara:strand:- start:795 stop:974 length:180 start_codon:yes stop_codon:yes gene_type:complete
MVLPNCRLEIPELCLAMDSSFPGDTGSSIDANRRISGECVRPESAKNAEKLTVKIGPLC